MTIIVAEETAVNVYLQECLTLAEQINETVSLVAQKEAEFVADGFKKPNLRALVAAVKKLNKPIGDVFFKNVSGAISVSAVQVDALLDANIRQKLAILVTKDITASAIEPTKNALLRTKINISKNFSIPSSIFKKMIENYSRDSTAFIKDGSLMLSISDGFKLDQI